MLYLNDSISERDISNGGIASYVIPGSPSAKKMGGGAARTIFRLATGGFHRKAEKRLYDFYLATIDWLYQLMQERNRLPLAMKAGGGVFFACTAALAEALDMDAEELREEVYKNGLGYEDVVAELEALSYDPDVVLRAANDDYVPALEKGAA